MASTFTPSIQLEEPARGDDVGTWDTPVNANSTLLDLTIGGVVGIVLNNSNVVLSAAQFKSKNIVFSSTLTGSVTITFPTSFTKSWEIYNLCTGSSAFTITLQTTAAGAQVICAPPGETVDIWSDSVNLRYKNLGRIGSYWDYAGSSVPAWVSGCTVAPYLNCDGTTFVAGTFPALASILGGTTLPDSRGRTRYALDAGVGRVSSAVSGVAGNTRFAGGGDQSLQAHNHGITDPGHVHNVPVNNPTSVTNGFIAGAAAALLGTAALTISAVTGITINSAGAGGAQNMPPVFIGGITMIRAG